MVMPALLQWEDLLPEFLLEVDLPLEDGLLFIGSMDGR